MLLRQENFFKDELPRARLRRRQIRECREPKFSLSDLFKRIQRSRDVSEKPALLPGMDPDSFVMGSECRRHEISRGVRGHAPQKILNFRL